MYMAGLFKETTEKLSPKAASPKIQAFAIEPVLTGKKLNLC